MKTFTDFNQSKILAKFLPVESADLYYLAKDDRGTEFFSNPSVKDGVCEDIDVPCWSLAALLGVLPVSCDDGQHCLALINSNPNEKKEWLCSYEDCKGDLILECYADNPIDACYEMILKLHELKMLYMADKSMKKTIKSFDLIAAKNGANLGDANLGGAKDVPFIPLNLPEGEFIAYKKVYDGVDYIVKLKILEDSKRSRATSDKCRYATRLLCWRYRILRGISWM